MLPRFAIDALRSGKYVTGLGQRLGKLPKLPVSERPLIWLHCVSVGETEAARPLVQALREHFPSYRLAISTTTVTGQQVAQRAFASDAVTIFYFPIDWAWTVRRVLRTLQPSVVLIMETELWPHLLRGCRQRSIPTALVNGRISPKSLHRYRKIRTFMNRVLNDLTMAMMQSDQDVSRILELGMPAQRTVRSGNLKFDGAKVGGSDETTSKLRSRFGLNEKASVIVAASTHAPEEQIVIDAFKLLPQNHNRTPLRLLIAPRHPERFGEVAEIIRSSGLTWARRSADPAPADASCEVVLLDSIGELRSVFPIATIAFIGGSITPHGGHNVLEPAAAGVCVITGPHTHNFAAIMDTFLAEKALVQLPVVAGSEAPSQLARTFDELLQDDSRRQEIGQRAMTVCARHRGAAERTIQLLDNLLSSPSSAKDPLALPAIHVTAAK